MSETESESDGANSKPESFSQFYEENRDQLVRAVGFALGNHEQGCEVVDAALTRAFERWDDVGTKHSPSAWVYRVAINSAKDRFRRRGTERRFAHLIARPQQTEEVPGTNPQLAAAVKKLTAKQRSVVVCRYFLDWDIATTADALDLPEGTVKSRTQRALAALAAELQRLDSVTGSTQPGAVSHKQNLDPESP